MAKRFTDSEKWKKIWFRSLEPTMKCLWIYILDNCDIAGFWEIDFDLAGYFIGENLHVEQIKKLFEKQFVETKDGKWFIKDFIDFQYGELKDNNNLHKSVIHRLKISGVFEGLNSPSAGDKVKVKEKEEVKEREIQEGVQGEIFENLPCFKNPDFKIAWQGWLEMRKKSKKAATKRAEILAYKKLETLAPNDIATQILIIDQSTQSNWTDFYELKNSQVKKFGKSFGVQPLTKELLQRQCESISDTEDRP